MKALYVNNFRGFSNTIIPIHKVNFLVGENSTGKTSILSLLKLILDPKFWLSSESVFNSDEVELGNFGDIVSIGSDDKSKFNVGFCDFTPKYVKENSDNKEYHQSMFLISFKNEKGIPRPITYSYLDSSNIVHVKIHPSSISYKKINFSQPSEFEEIITLFNTSINEHNIPSKGYKKIPKPPNFFPLAVIETIISKYTSSNTDFQVDLSKFTHDMQEITWIAPIREKPRRTYDQYKKAYSSEGTHTPYLLNDFLGAGNKSKKNNKKELLKNLEKFGIDSGLFESIAVKRYGQHNTAPFGIDVVINKEPLLISNVGYGVSQVLPVIVECFTRQKGSFFAIQQPEVHLHPKAQASLGRYIYTLSEEEGKQFMIETHSDFLIDRFRMQVSKSENKESADSQVLFFSRTQAGNSVHSIMIENDGNYSEEQPAEFREFFLKEELDMLSL